MKLLDAINKDLEILDILLSKLKKHLLTKNTEIDIFADLDQNRTNLLYIIDKLDLVDEIYKSKETIRQQIGDLMKSEVCKINVDESFSTQLEIGEKTGEIPDIPETLEMDEIFKLNPGEQTRYIIKKLIYDKKLIGEAVNNFTDKEWCKNNFLIQYPLLKKHNLFLSDSEQRLIEGKIKYIAQPYIIDGEAYYLNNAVSGRSIICLLEYYKSIYQLDSNIGKIDESNYQIWSIDKELGDFVKRNTIAPSILKFNDKLFPVSGWPDLMYIIIYEIINNIINVETYKQLKSGITNGEVNCFSKLELDLLKPKVIQPGLYLQTSYSVETTIKHIIKVMEICKDDLYGHTISVYCSKGKPRKINDETAKINTEIYEDFQFNIDFIKEIANILNTPLC